MVGFFKIIEENAGEDSVRWSDLESKSRKQWLVDNLPKRKSEAEIARKKWENLEKEVLSMEAEIQIL